VSEILRDGLRWAPGSVQGSELNRTSRARHRSEQLFETRTLRTGRPFLEWPLKQGHPTLPFSPTHLRRQLEGLEATELESS
jgi:hypothetical protein